MTLRALSDIPDAIESLARTGSRSGRNWSLAQITEHIARTIEWSMDPEAHEPAPQLNMSRVMVPLARWMTLLTGWIPENLPTFRHLEAPASIDLTSAVERLRRAIASFDAYENSFPVHPFLGRMTKRQWRRFHVIHARHHLKIVQRSV